jgi:hypothetical protein
MARAPQHQIKAASSTLKVTASEELKKKLVPLGKKQMKKISQSF